MNMSDDTGQRGNDCGAPVVPRANRRQKRRNAGGARPRVRLPYWVVARTKGGQENWARVNVENQGLRTLLPRYLPPDRKWKPEVMFPGYLFVEIYPDRAWSFLLSTRGIVGLLMTNGRLDRVPVEFIKQLIASQDADGLITLPKRRPLIRGELVELSQGSFQNQIGVYDGDSVGDRVRVLFEFMGHQVPYDVERHKVNPVNK